MAVLALDFQRLNTTLVHATKSIHVILVQPLNGRLVGNRHNRLGHVVLHRDGPRLPGHGRLSLQVDVLALLLGLLPQPGVLLDSSQELIAGLGCRHVLDTERDTLLNVAVLDLLEDDDADRVLGDVVDDTSLAVVDLVGHTAMG